MSIRHKSKPVLLMNKRTATTAIYKYSVQGRKEERDRAQRILDATLDELKRRGIED